MRLRFIFIVLMGILLLSCRSTRTVNGSATAISALGVKEIIKTHQLAAPDFNTLAGRIKVSYEDEKQSQSMTVSLRMEKGKNIWIKASILGITLAKVLITPEQVSYYESISNTYFEGDFRVISDWLGTEVDFEKTQAILLGQSMFKMDNKGYTSDIIDNKYRLMPKRQAQNLIYSILLNPENFKVASAEVSQPYRDRMFSVEYGPYQQLSGGYFPSEVYIRSFEGSERTNIDVSYRKIDLDVDVSFPFSIPAGYQKIELER